MIPRPVPILSRCASGYTKSPNLNAYAERFVLSIKSECLDRLVLIGERHLRHAIDEYAEHYHLERTHQGLDNKVQGRACAWRYGALAPVKAHTVHILLEGE
jgi:transposase InsO family protein